MKKIELPLQKAHRAILPRIAYLVTSVDSLGRINAASFSNVTPVSTDPQRLVLSTMREWDAFRNIVETREFVVNVPRGELMDDVWMCGSKYAGIPIPRDVNELNIADLTSIGSIEARPP